LASDLSLACFFNDKHWCHIIAIADYIAFIVTEKILNANGSHFSDITIHVIIRIVYPWVVVLHSEE